MNGNNCYDPNLHLFLDDVEVQDHPGFVRKVQRPERVQTEPVLKPDRPWEGKAVQLWGSVLYDDDENCFKMWYYAINNDLYERTGQGHFMCYATSKDGIAWEKPELGIVACEGSRANNIVYPRPGVHYGLDPWGVVKDPQEQDPSKRYKMGMYQQRPLADAPQETPAMDRPARNALRQVLFAKIRDRHGMYAAFSPDGIHWRLDDRNCVPRAGDAGALVYDPMQRRYLAVSRRFETLMDHFVLEWKQYRRVIALSSSEDFIHWTPLRTILKPDDFDDPRDQLYAMVPFVYGRQYIGFIGMLHSATELGSGATGYGAAARPLAAGGPARGFFAGRLAGRLGRGLVLPVVQSPRSRGGHTVHVVFGPSPSPRHRGQFHQCDRASDSAQGSLCGAALRHPRRRIDDRTHCRQWP